MKKRILITGGAGFIGVNVANYFLSQRNDVTVLDNLSRKGSSENISWLRSKYSSMKFIKADVVKDAQKLRAAVRGQDIVCHFAGQVAVTTSVIDPYHDFLINAQGTFLVLEAVRLHAPAAVLVYSSTNKVYGGMEDIHIVRRNNRYCYRDFPRGIPEDRLLDFHSPYGCSKGAADQYVRDYARIYGLKTIVFRQSCIYGYRQFGVEDQGWVAWFIIAALTGKPITLYGDGRQVRDVLFIEDLIRAYSMAVSNPRTFGKIYNIGGGPVFTMSLLELLSMLEKMLKRDIPVTFADWRPGDQPVFVSDIRKAYREFGWKPRVSAEAGVAKLVRWVQENIHLFKGRFV